MYGSDQRLYASPLRYALVDRSPGLSPARNGSLTLYLQHRTPTRTAPRGCPLRREPFTVAMRLYEPRASLFAGRWTPPGIRCLDWGRPHR